jgi:hypothetical protein
MRIGVLTHNYPRFRRRLSAASSSRRSAREYGAAGTTRCACGRLTIAAFTRPDTAGEWGGVQVAPLTATRGRVRRQQAGLHALHAVGDLTFEACATMLLSPALFAAGIAKVRRVYAGRVPHPPHVLHAHWLLPNGLHVPRWRRSGWGFRCGDFGARLGRPGGRRKPALPRDGAQGLRSRPGVATHRQQRRTARRRGPPWAPIPRALP